MVNFRRLSDRAKDVVEKRGGTEALKRDANELRDIAKGPGSLKEKAKRAADAIKEPGTAAEGAGTAETPTAAKRPAEEAGAAETPTAGKRSAEPAAGTPEAPVTPRVKGDETKPGA